MRGAPSAYGRGAVAAQQPHVAEAGAVQQAYDLRRRVDVVRRPRALDRAGFVGEDVVGLEPALRGVVAIDPRHADPGELDLRVRRDPAGEQGLRDGRALEHEPPAGSQQPVHAGQRADGVGRGQIAEAVAPAHEPVGRPGVGQVAQVADQEAGIDARRRGSAARVLDLGGGDLDPGHGVAGGGETQSDPPVAARHVDHRRAGRQGEQPGDHPRVLLGHGCARRAPEAGDQAGVEPDEPVVGDPRCFDSQLRNLACFVFDKDRGGPRRTGVAGS